MLQPAVIDLVALGPIPASDSASEEWLRRVEGQLKGITTPISDDDARALAGLLGADDCFGLPWAILHLIESAPGWPLVDVLASPKNEWIERLQKRAANSAKSD